MAATTNAIMALADELAELGIERVVVESTSDYWRPFFYLLEARGLLVWLVNARDVKQVPGRPKTDKLDAVWLAKLNERGMLRPCFVPPARSASCATTPGCGSTWSRSAPGTSQRLEKLLEDALIKLSTVATDIFGKSGRAMLEALIAGERDPEVLADLALGKMRVKHAALVEALTGRFDEHHAELARMLLDQIDTLGEKIDAAHRPGRAARRPAFPSPAPRRRGDGDGPPVPLDAASARAAGRDPRRSGSTAAQTIIAEVGLEHGPVPDRRPPRVVGEALAPHDPVRAPEPFGSARARETPT